MVRSKLYRTAPLGTGRDNDVWSTLIVCVRLGVVMGVVGCGVGNGTIRALFRSNPALCEIETCRKYTLGLDLVLVKYVATEFGRRRKPS